MSEVKHENNIDQAGTSEALQQRRDVVYDFEDSESVLDFFFKYNLLLNSNSNPLSNTTKTTRKELQTLSTIKDMIRLEHEESLNAAYEELKISIEKQLKNVRAYDLPIGFKIQLEALLDLSSYIDKGKEAGTLVEQYAEEFIEDTKAQDLTLSQQYIYLSSLENWIKILKNRYPEVSAIDNAAAKSIAAQAEVVQGQVKEAEEKGNSIERINSMQRQVRAQYKVAMGLAVEGTYEIDEKREETPELYAKWEEIARKYIDCLIGQSKFEEAFIQAHSIIDRNPDAIDLHDRVAPLIEAAIKSLPVVESVMLKKDIADYTGLTGSTYAERGNMLLALRMLEFLEAIDPEDRGEWKTMITQSMRKPQFRQFKTSQFSTDIPS